MALSLKKSQAWFIVSNTFPLRDQFLDGCSWDWKFLFLLSFSCWDISPQLFSLFISKGMQLFQGQLLIMLLNQILHTNFHVQISFAVANTTKEQKHKIIVLSCPLVWLCASFFFLSLYVIFLVTVCGLTQPTEAWTVIRKNPELSRHSLDRLLTRVPLYPNKKKQFMTTGTYVLVQCCISKIQL